MHHWGKRFGGYDGEAKTCADAPKMCTSDRIAQTLYLEECCPGACSKGSNMNPIKYIVDNKLEHEVRCLSRFAHFSIGGAISNYNQQDGTNGDWVMQTCE